MSSSDEEAQSSSGESNHTIGEDDQAPQMFDASQYIFESLVNALDAVDFAQALSLQTKTSAVLNDRTLQLKSLVQETKERLAHLEERYREGIKGAKRTQSNIEQCRKRVSQLNGVLRMEYPIEYNMAREKVLERQLDEESEDTVEETTTSQE